MVATTLLGSLLGGLTSHLWRGFMLGRGWLTLGFGRLLPRLAAGVVIAGLIVEVAVWQAGIYVTGAYTWKSSTAGRHLRDVVQLDLHARFVDRDLRRKSLVHALA